ncbi:MAG: ATP phosphoribosyltransferase regulatory subunit [Clostridia bacterium]|nr:ATP phosphoribosyltransferase regulatory subunit [Clostridia bacterium]
MRLVPNGFVRRALQDLASEQVLAGYFAKAAEKSGYARTLVSALYPIGESFFGTENRYKLIDREGDLLCVTEDAVTGLLNACEDGLNRLYTHTEVYRYRGEDRNVRQCAALLAGVAGPEAEAEVILLGLEVLRSLGVNGKVKISSTYVLQGLAEVYFGYRPDAETVIAWINAKPRTDAESAMFTVIDAVKRMCGGAEVIKDATELLTNRVSGVGLKNVLDLYDVLCGLGKQDQVEIDLSVMGRPYDCGSVFEIVDEENNVLLRGGRHDFLRGAETIRATSIVMVPAEVMTYYRVKETTKASVVLGVETGIIALSAAYKLKEDLIEAGVPSVSMLYGVGAEDTARYAEAFGIESAVFVDGEGKASAVK